MKKRIFMFMVLVLSLSLVSCKGEEKGENKKEALDLTNEIGVVSREEGSGTRSAFIELFKVEEKDASDKKVDKTTEKAIITNSTSVMMTSVEGNEYTIGYVSLGSLSDRIKALKIDGTDISVENIKNGKYQIARPFNIVVRDDLSESAKDFIDFIMSKDGQKVIEDMEYVSNGGENSYKLKEVKEKVVIAGSSSISPLMEKLKEAYLLINDKAEIEIQQSDSSTGVTSTIEKTADIGMASRELKDSEKEKGVEGIKIAMDGIAVIVNKKLPLEDISKEDVKKIYTGEVETWKEIIK